jgi:putative transcriptional regulator
MAAMDFTNQFLIAMPSLEDPNFSRTVTYICAHSDEGAMGIVVNRPLELELSNLFDQLQLETSTQARSSEPVVMGGPVETQRGFVLFEPEGNDNWDGLAIKGEDIALATSRDIVAAMARGEGPKRHLVALGYAGWGAGQLEHEVLENAWLNGPAKTEIIFECAFDERWQRAAELLGVDVHRLSASAGHS